MFSPFSTEGIMTFRIIGREMLNISHFLIGRRRHDPQQRLLMGFVFGLIKWIGLKNLTDVLLPRSFIATRPGTHIVSISGGSAQLGAVTGTDDRFTTRCSYRAPSKSMRLVHTVSHTATFRNTLHRSILCFFTIHGWENDLPLCNVTSYGLVLYVRMADLALGGGHEHVSVKIVERKSSV